MGEYLPFPFCLIVKNSKIHLSSPFVVDIIDNNYLVLKVFCQIHEVDYGNFGGYTLVKDCSHVGQFVLQCTFSLLVFLLNKIDQTVIVLNSVGSVFLVN
jgi:hypothetical protein